MNIQKWRPLGASIFFLLLFYVFTDFPLLELLLIALFVYFMIDFLQNLGEKLVIFDLTILLAIATCLVMPVVFYHVFTKENRLAFIWRKYMFVPSDEYFSFALPAIVMMIIGFRLPVARQNVYKDPVVYMNRMKEDLKKKPRVGMYLIGIGI